MSYFFIEESKDPIFHVYAVHPDVELEVEFDECLSEVDYSEDERDDDDGGWDTWSAWSQKLVSRKFDQHNCQKEQKLEESAHCSELADEFSEFTDEDTSEAWFTTCDLSRENFSVPSFEKFVALVDGFVWVLQLHQILSIDVLLGSEVHKPRLPDLKHLSATIASNIAFDRGLQVLVTLHPK